MFEKRILNSEFLGKEQEKELLIYEGWVILAQVRTRNFIQTVEWAKKNLTDNQSQFNEDNNRFYISYTQSGQELELVPDRVKYKDNQTGKWETYNLIIESDFWGFKTGAEKKHQEFCKELLSLLPRKRGFLIRGGKRFSITE
jgi:hypothetical protein